MNFKYVMGDMALYQDEDFVADMFDNVVDKISRGNYVW